MYIILGYINANDPPEVVNAAYVYATWYDAFDALQIYIQDTDNRSYFSFYRIAHAIVQPPPLPYASPKQTPNVS